MSRASRDRRRRKTNRGLDAGLKLLRTATSWYSANDITSSTQQSLPNRNGAGEAQRGSTAGSDTNDPVFLPHDGQSYVWTPAGANSVNITSGVTIPVADTLDQVIRKDESVASGTLTNVLGAGSARFYVAVASSTSFSVSTTEDGTTNGVGTNVDLPGYRTALWLQVQLDQTGDRVRGRLSNDPTYDSGSVIWEPWTAWVDIATPVKPLVDGGIFYLYGGGSSSASSRLYSFDFLVDGAPLVTMDPDNLDPWTVTRSTTGLKTAVVTRPVPVFDGVDDYLQLPASDTPTFTATTGKHTVVLAYRTHADGTGFRRLYSSESASNNGISFQLSATNMRAYVGDGVSQVGIGPLSTAHGQLNVIAFVVDDGAASLYAYGEGLTATSSIAALGAISHTTPRLMAYGYTTSGRDGEVFSAVSASGVALTEEELDAVATRLLKEHS